MKYVGGLLRPGSEFAIPESELVKLAGFGKNIEASRKEARQLLKEAGVPEGFSFTLKNRNVREPYEVTGVYVIDQWRQVGLNVTHVQQEEGAYFNDFRQGNYDAGIDFSCDFMDDPDLQLFKFVSSDKSPVNYARYNDSVLDDLYDKQSRATDPKERLKLLRQFEKRVIDEKAYQFPHPLVAAHRAALDESERLEDHTESLRQSGPTGRLAGGVINAEDRGLRIEDCATLYVLSSIFSRP